MFDCCSLGHRHSKNELEVNCCKGFNTSKIFRLLVGLRNPAKLYYDKKKSSSLKDIQSVRKNLSMFQAKNSLGLPCYSNFSLKRTDVFFGHPVINVALA
jgi:hypothetical protein